MMMNVSTLPSLAVSVSLHAAVLFSGLFAFIRPADYGIQGSAASIEVYMVAALPEVSKVTEASIEPEKILTEIPKGQSDMVIPEEPAAVKKTEPESQNKGKVLSEKARKKSEFIGDGSSTVPGPSQTTFYSVASSEVIGKAGKYKNRPPVYPTLARELGQQGLVLLSAVIDEKGYPKSIKVKNSSGYSLLDDAARKAVKKWRFEPAKMVNQNINSELNIPIRFILKGNE